MHHRSLLAVLAVAAFIFTTLSIGGLAQAGERGKNDRHDPPPPGIEIRVDKNAAAVIGIEPGPSLGDYESCVEFCIDKLPGGSAELAACIQGCAKVNSAF